MSNYYQRAKFLLSVGQLPQLPNDEGLEVAFAGRSNAGKSSAINTLTNQVGLARTSKTPGRTQLLNFFSLDEQRRLVDLPGYGYAKVPNEVKQRWYKTLDEYLSQRKCLVGLVLLMDIRHPLKEFDQTLLTWSVESEMPVRVLLTKSDKLSTGAAKAALLAVAHQIKDLYASERISIQLFSSLSRQGVDEFAVFLNTWYQLETPLKKSPGGT